MNPSGDAGAAIAEFPWAHSTSPCADDAPDQFPGSDWPDATFRFANGAPHGGMQLNSTRAVRLSIFRGSGSAGAVSGNVPQTPKSEDVSATLPAPRPGPLRMLHSPRRAFGGGS
eukprot:1730202-Prymnesium_polylepis.1